jgi:tetratricopeptide (TPR) repeat protein
MPLPLTTLLVATIGLAALAPAAEPADDPAADPAAEQTRDLFDRAATQYETSQYNGAVETYTEAYRRSVAIADEELRGLVQAAILFNLARAHVKAYALDKSVEHLLQAIDLLDKYLAQTADLADQRDAEQLLEQAKAELARVEQQAAATEPGPREDQGRRDDRKLRIAGYTLIGFGVAGGGAAIAGAVLAGQARTDYTAGPTRDDRDSAARSGQLSNALIVAGSVSAGVLIGVGVVLAVVGRKRPGVAPTAWVTPTSAGLALGGSF